MITKEKLERWVDTARDCRFVLNHYKTLFANEVLEIVDRADELFQDLSALQDEYIAKYKARGKTQSAVKARAKYWKKYKRTHKDHIRESHREYYEKNKELIREKQKAYRLKKKGEKNGK